MRIIQLPIFRGLAAAAYLLGAAPLSYAAEQSPAESTQNAGGEPAPDENPASVLHRVVWPFEELDDLTFYILRPAELDPSGHKVLLYFVGGGQEERYVKQAMGSHIAREAVERGFIFISPAAPCWSCTFVAKGDKYFPAFFEKLSDVLPMSENRFHLMGYSNGGKSSLHLGTQHPEWVASITAYPGYLRSRDYEMLERLEDICVVMYVSRDDEFFYQRHQRDVARLKRNGHPVYEKLYRREGHTIGPLWSKSGAKTLMDGVENRLGCSD